MYRKLCSEVGVVGDFEPSITYKQPRLGQFYMQGVTDMKSQTHKHANTCDAVPTKPRLMT